MRHLRIPVISFMNGIGFRKGFVRIAFLHFPCFHDVGPGPFRRRIAYKVRQHFILDANGSRGIASLLFGFRRNRDELLPGPEHLCADREDNLHGFDAGHFLGNARINRGDFGMCVRRERKLCVEHARAVHVERIFRAAR